MTNHQREMLTYWTFGGKVQGWGFHAHPESLEGDGRKLKKTMRELVEAGYLSQSGLKYTVTNKLYEEIVPEPVDLIAIWEHDRKDGWNKRREYPFVRFDKLTHGQKKTVLECAGHYQWFVCNHTPLQYDLSVLQPTDMAEIINPDVGLADKVKAMVEVVKDALRKEKRAGNFPETEIVLKIKGLTDYIDRTLAAEKFDALYRSNLKWALSSLDVLPSEEAKEIVSSEEPGWVLGGGANSNLGTDPEKWGETLTERITSAKEAIERHTKRLAIMERIEQGVAKMGGWDAFREQYKAKLTEQLAKGDASE
jgi:hypothetical protein